MINMEENKEKALYIISWIVGIIAICTSWFFFLGFVITVISLILSIIAIVKMKNNNEKSDYAKIAIVLSIIAILISLFVNYIAYGSSRWNDTVAKIKGDLPRQYIEMYNSDVLSYNL